jgi:tetratricopeptide (TPR) repeat protein
MPFEASSTEPRGDWLGELASVAITREFRAAGVSAIRRDDRLQAMERLRVPDVPLLSHATVIRLASVVGATSSRSAASRPRRRSWCCARGRSRGHRVHGRRDRRTRARAATCFAIAARVGRRIVPEMARAERGGRGRAPPVAAFELFVRSLDATNPRRASRCSPTPSAQAPALDDARFALWDAYTEQGEHQRARTAVHAVSARATRGGAAFLEAVSELQLGRFQEAWTGFSTLQKDHADAALANDMGVVQLRLPGADRRPRTCSASDGARCERRDPLLQSRIRAWIAREYPQAVAALRDAVRRSPADEDAHYVLGAALQAAGSADEGAREKDLARRLSSVYQRSRCAPHGQLGTARTGAAEDGHRRDVAHARRERAQRRGASASSASWCRSISPTAGGCIRPSAMPTRWPSCGARCSCRRTRARPIC